MKQLEAMGYAPQLSNKGNVSVEIGGVGAPLVLAAHVDTLGAMVRSIKDNGRLRPTTIGGHQWSTADGENCMVFTRDGRMYTGVVLNTEPSAHVADEKVETKEENMEILLDENVNDKQGVAALGIQTGILSPWIHVRSSRRAAISRAVSLMISCQPPSYSVWLMP